MRNPEEGFARTSEGRPKERLFIIPRAAVEGGARTSFMMRDAAPLAFASL
jgi:hypothetical protein